MIFCNIDPLQDHYLAAPLSKGVPMWCNIYMADDQRMKDVSTIFGYTRVEAQHVLHNEMETTNQGPDEG